MKPAENDTILTQKFISEFNCIGGMCEDDCCHGWAINVEKKAFMALTKLYRNVSDGKHARLGALKHNKHATNEWDYGTIRVRNDQPCPFLKPGGLCDIHSRFGHHRLGWVCKDYPRVLVNVNGRLELTATLSCPETARLCLPRPGSTQLIEVDQEVRNRLSGNINVPPPGLANSPYLELFGDVRQILLLLADAHQYDTNGRLYLMLYFAHRINAFFRADTTSLCMDELNEAVEHIADPDTHSRLVREFHDKDYDPIVSMTTTQALLTFRLDNESEFKDFVRSCLGSCKELDTEKDDRSTRDSLAAVIQTYFDRRNRIEGAHWSRLETYFGNYISYYLFNHWYLASPTLINYLRDLFIQLNIIKFLFFMNPMLDPLLDCGQPANADQAKACDNLLDKAIVQTVYQCGRGLEHLHPILLKAISQSLDEQGMNDFETLSMLAKA